MDALPPRIILGTRTRRTEIEAGKLLTIGTDHHIEPIGASGFPIPQHPPPAGRTRIIFIRDHPPVVDVGLDERIPRRLLRDLIDARDRILHNPGHHLIRSPQGRANVRSPSSCNGRAPRRVEERLLRAVEGVGDERAQSLYDGFQKNAPVIAKMSTAGVPVDNALGLAASTVSSGSAIAGVKAVVSGAMSGSLAHLNRNAVQELIEASGGTASGSVSSSTTLLICNEPGSSKSA